MIIIKNARDLHNYTKRHKINHLNNQCIMNIKKMNSMLQEKCKETNKWCKMRIKKVKFKRLKNLK